MRVETNKFGTSQLYDINDVQGSIYVLGCACMSIQAEMLSYANAHPDRFIKDPVQADNIIVLSCQVTDLAVLSDLRHLVSLKCINKQYVEDNRNFYIGGCLAKRYDIELPRGVRRLDAVKSDYTQIKDTTLIDYAKPFWVKDFTEGDEIKDGRLFRDMYPLRIGVGCKGTCKYCTIRVTRGETYELDISRLTQEFMENDDVVLIAESPTAKQVRQWCMLAFVQQKAISIRNLEPHTYASCRTDLLGLAEDGLLKILHVPIQSMNEDILKDMGRNVGVTKTFLMDVPELQSFGTFVATNIIIDYKSMPQNIQLVYDLFDYVSWNPYWDGNWDCTKAVERYNKYIG